MSNFEHGSDHQFLLTVPSNIGLVQRVNLSWKYVATHLLDVSCFWGVCNQRLYVNSVTISSMNSYSAKGYIKLIFQFCFTDEADDFQFLFTDYYMQKYSRLQHLLPAVHTWSNQRKFKLGLDSLESVDQATSHDSSIVAQQNFIYYRCSHVSILLLIKRQHAQ